MLASAGNRHIQSSFNLLQIFIQRAAQIGKALIIGWGKGNF